MLSSIMVLSRFARNGLLAAITTFAATALPAEEMPAAFPEEVGMSSELLVRIGAAMQRHIDSGEIQGAVTAVARRGKVVHFEAHGLMDVERGPGHAEGCDLSHGLLVEAGARRGGDDADRGGAAASHRRGRRLPAAIRGDAGRRAQAAGGPGRQPLVRDRETAARASPGAGPSGRSRSTTC